MKQAYFYFIFLSVLASNIYADNDNFDTEIGFSLGTPSAINFVIKKPVGDQILQFSGGTLGKNTLYGLEVGASILYYPDKNWRSVQVISGFVHSERAWSNDKELGYIGISTTFRLGGFFLEPGVVIGDGDYSGPQMAMQMGWLW